MRYSGIQCAELTFSSTLLEQRKLSTLLESCLLSQGDPFAVPKSTFLTYIFRRDNALPGSRLWKKVNSYTQTPVNAVWFVIGCSAICGVLGFSETALTSLAGYFFGLFVVPAVAHNPMSRASVIGLYTSYVVPILLRITSGRDKLVPGPFSLGRWSTPIGAVAFAWVSFIVVLLLFPAGESVSGTDMS